MRVVGGEGAAGSARAVGLERVAGGERAAGLERVAAFDCGTNSLRLLVAEPHGSGLRDVVRQMRIVRLGEGVDATGRISREALERTLSALRELSGLAREAGARRTRMVATSATRDAANREEFVAGVRGIIGVEPEVVTGAQEAALSFSGAVASIDPEHFPGPYLVIDIGGGSTEFVLGADRVLSSTSVDIGCVRLTERWLRSDPPTAQEIAGAEADIVAALARVRSAVPVQRAASVIGLAGTVTTVAALALGLDAYDAARIHHSVIAREAVESVACSLLAARRSERAALAVMHPGRVDVIGAGALILRTICRELGVGEVVASEHDILDGIATSLLEP